MNKKLFILPALVLGFAVAALPAKKLVSAKAEGEVSLSFSECATWDLSGASLGKGICIKIASPTSGTGCYTWDGTGGAITSFNGINMYDQKGNLVTFSFENVNDRFMIDRSYGDPYFHYGYTIDIASGATISLANGTTYAVDKAYRYVEETNPEQSGTIWASVDPTTSVSLADLGTVTVGDTVNADVTIAPATATQLKFYESSDTTVATVNDAGVISAVGVGTANITIYSGLLSATKTITVNPASSPITGVELDPSTITVTQYNGYNLSDIHLYAVRDTRAEVIPVTSEMISGTFDPNTVGTYSLTVSYETFSATLTVNVVALPAFSVDDFGLDTWFYGQFYFATTRGGTGQYLHIQSGIDLDVFNHVKSHVLINNSHDNLERACVTEGNRVALFYNSLEAGDVIVIQEGFRIYQWSGTTDGASWTPNSPGRYIATDEVKADIKFTYNGSSWSLCQTAEDFIGEFKTFLQGKCDGVGGKITAAEWSNIAAKYNALLAEDKAVIAAAYENADEHLTDDYGFVFERYSYIVEQAYGYTDFMNLGLTPASAVNNAFNNISNSALPIVLIIIGGIAIFGVAVLLLKKKHN